MVWVWSVWLGSRLWLTDTGRLCPYRLGALSAAAAAAAATSAALLLMHHFVSLMRAIFYIVVIINVGAVHTHTPYRCPPFWGVCVRAHVCAFIDSQTCDAREMCNAHAERVGSRGK